ncbi:MAG: serine hydrolase [Xanthomonadales bacterium]|nr:serine hydrolase [Xanthomonadales bacterium]
MIRCPRFTAFVIVLALTFTCSRHEDLFAAMETGDDNPIIDALFAAWDIPGSPGCALAVAQDGALVYSRGYGYANLDYDIPITPQTVFDVGSVTKQFVAANLTLLALDGKLALEDNVRRWLPELPEYQWPITLQQMIYHTSGLRDYLDLFPLAGRDDYYPISPAQILAMMSLQQALIFRPGDRYLYSNTAYMLLAQVVQRASGQALGEMAQQRIFGPLGMTSSRMYENLEEIIPKRATGYDRDGAGGLRIVHNYNFDVAGDGQLYTTVEDLLRWDNYLHGAEKPPIEPLMLYEGHLNNGDPVGYAQGIQLEEYRGLRSVGHSGSSWGFRTELVRFVEPGLSIVTACNADFAKPGELAQRVADYYLADQLGPASSAEEPGTGQQEDDPQSEPPSLSSAQLAEFTGEYFSAELDATYRFEVVGGGLNVRIEQEPALEVRSVAEDEFEFSFQPHGWSEPQPVSLAFDRNPSGANSGFGLSMGPERGIVFERRQEPAGLVIVNARVVDGSGGPSRNVNVRIAAERIAEVGNFEPSAADAVVDAAGLVLAPGFIDVHSHHDDGLFESPGALAAVSQGITTIVAGQDGTQNYPLAEFFAELETSPVAINIASYAGHGTLRGMVMGEDYQRQATGEELAQMASLLGAEMEAGSLGLSSGLEYDPGSFSATKELVELAQVAARHGGRYISHIRSEDQYFWAAIDEAILIGREARIPVQVSHIKLAMSRWWGQASRLTDTLDQARASGVDISADIYPYRAWNAGFSWLTTVFPNRDLDRRDGAEYILRDMLSPEGILVASYKPKPAYDGMNIAQIAEIRGSDAETTLMELLKADKAMGGEQSGSQMLGFAMDEPDIEAIMAWPYTVIGSDGDLAGPHPRGFGAFTRFLGHYLRDRKVLSLEGGIRRMTSLSAQQVGIAERGLIQVGQYADLVLFDPRTVKDIATTEAPHLPSVGIEKVWVNGQLVFAGGQITGKVPGKPIRRARL